MPDMHKEHVEEPTTEKEFNPLDAAVKAMEGELETKGESQEEPDEKATEEEKQGDAEEAGEEEEQEEHKEEEEAEEQEVEKKSNLQAIARQEEQLREKKADFKKEQEEWERQVAEAQSSLEDFNRLVKSGSVVKVLQALGVKNLQAAAEEIYLHELGDDAPEDLKTGHKTTVLSRRIEELEEKLDRQTRELEEKRSKDTGEAEMRRYVDSLNSFVEGSSDDDYPYLKTEVADDRNETMIAMCDVADAIYKSTGEIPTPEQVATELESSLKTTIEKYRKFFEPKEKTAEKPKEKKKASTTLSVKKTSPKSSYKSGAVLDEDEMLARAEASMKEEMSRH